MRSRFFSVSPMYLDTIVARSTRKISSPSSAASTCAAIVLPVPDSPANSTFRPCVRATALLVAPVRQHAVAVAQVRRDRLQQLALALGHHEVVPAEAGREPRRELAEPRRGRLAGTEVELFRRRCRAPVGGGGEPRHLGGLDDLADREPELRGHVAGLRRAGEVRPRLAALGERRRRRVDEQHRPVAERERGGAVRRGEHRALGCAARAPASRARARGGSRSSRPSKTSWRSSIADASRASAITSRWSDVARVDAPPAGGRAPWRAATRRPARRAPPAACSSCASIAATDRTASSRPGSCAGIGTSRSRGGGGSSSMLRAEQERGQPVGDLERPLGQRRRRLAHQPQRAERAAAARRGRTSASRRRRSRRRPRAGARRAAGSAACA